MTSPAQLTAWIARRQWTHSKPTRFYTYHVSPNQDDSQHAYSGRDKKNRAPNAYQQFKTMNAVHILLSYGSPAPLFFSFIQDKKDIRLNKIHYMVTYICLQFAHKTTWQCFNSSNIRTPLKKFMPLLF